ncbi:MAG TPA: peptidylprolyl isomerase [Ignisphaera sp.]|uniref:Peptidyl-prolyl cis-trans isomerase n=1 Tax=Ignisphaera aggregans TaxID=334771 RepID=A0A832YXU1_9CREN|nr:peptidylprolyl isomerase [Ignisphaera sp.]HIP56804.1 peptidylprolyl isomerase [Ignisphaera aggregans]
MAISKNTFILVDYTIRVKDTNELVDTTIEEIAKRENKYDPEKVYAPILVIVGEGRLIPGFEEHIESSGEVGKEFTIEIPPEKAYGHRDPSKVKVLNARELLRNGVVPEVGKVVEIGGNIGIIRAVSGGRVLIDFNHPLAGKTLICTYKILKIIEDDAEKIRYLLHRRYRRMAPERFIVITDENEKKVTIELPREIYFDRDIQIVKALVAEEIYKYIGKYDTVIYVEKFSRTVTTEGRT